MKTKQERQLKALELFDAAFERFGKGLEEFRDALDSSIQTLNGLGAELEDDEQSQQDYKTSLKNDY